MLWCVSVALFLVALGVLSRLPALAIREIIVENETSVPTGKIEALVRGELRGAYGLLIARNTTLFYPKRAIRDGVLAAFPEIGSVNLRRQAGGVLVLALSPRESQALWCGEEPGAAAVKPRECFLLDSEGFVFAEAEGQRASSTDYVYFGALADAPHGTSSSRGARFLASAAFAELEELRHSLRASLVLEPLSTALVGPDAIVRLASGTELYFSQSEPFDAALANLATLIASRTGTSTALRAHALDGLEYVDVRFGNRLYYR
jgi:hypothetical protein